MKDFKKSFRGNRSEGGPRGGGRSGGFGGGNRDRRDGGFSRDRNNFSRDFSAPQMHKTSCSSCGNMAEVPFKPTGDKPVLCSNCFGSKRDGGRSSDRRDNGRGSRDRRESGSFNRPSTPDQSKDIRTLQDQIKALHVKMDVIMKSLNLEVFGDESKKKEKVVVQSSDIREEKKPVKVPKIQKPKPEELTKAVVNALKEKTTKKAAPKKATKKITTKKVAKKSTAKKAIKKTTKKK